MLSRWFAAAFSPQSGSTQLTIHDIDREIYATLPGETVQTTVLRESVEFKRLKFGRLVIVFAVAGQTRSDTQPAGGVRGGAGGPPPRLSIRGSGVGGGDAGGARGARGAGNSGGGG